MNHLFLGIIMRNFLVMLKVFDTIVNVLTAQNSRAVLQKSGFTTLC